MNLPCGTRERDPWRYEAGSLSLLVLAPCLLSVACSRLPEMRYLKTPLSAVATPTVINGAGLLGDKETSRLLAKRLGPSRGHATLLAALEESATGRPLIAGNKVTLLFDGPSSIGAMMRAVAEARDTINLETYLFDRDPMGDAFADLLILKQREGVQVSIIYDCVGTLGTPQHFFDRMKEAGIRLLPFHPVNPFHKLGHWRINNRDHRKILVVDGKVAFTGGVNITAAYSSKSLFRSVNKTPASIGWRDTHLQIEGPAVKALQVLFLENWASQDEGGLPDLDYFPGLSSAGEEVIRVIASRPGGIPEIFKAYYMAILGAQKSIHMTAAYFVPDTQILGALLDAARRGVDVKIILPSVSDSSMVFQAGHSFYRQMLEGGIHVYELNTAVLHAKTAVIDGNWSTVGSANMDMRSFLHNKEVNVVVLGDDFGREMGSAFAEDLKDSTEITLESWKRRPFGNRCREWFARVVGYLL